jgi:hypothetical protein
VGLTIGHDQKGNQPVRHTADDWAPADIIII